MTPTRDWTVALVAGAAMLVAACGGGGEPSTYSEQDVIEAAGLEPEEGSFVTASGCPVAIVLLGEPQIALYEEAGDVVATNPDGTAGVKTLTPQGSISQEECVSEIEEGLQSLD